MKELQYKDFSLATHKKNWRKRRPNVCQFELTFSCGLHCQHCYSDCYNEPDYIKKELTTEEIKYLLDKIRDSGIIWLCFTGGDPLARADFLEIYSYAKNKGFIITIFTNGFSMTQNLADYLAKFPPFVIEITLNAVTKKTFEEISQRSGSFEKTMQGLTLILERNLPLKIKTMVTKKNLEEIHRIKKFVEDLGMKFNPSCQIYPRLNHDLTPCSLRVRPGEVLEINEELGLGQIEAQDCFSSNFSEAVLEKSKYLFRCAAGGGDGVHIDPYGKMFFCPNIRRPAVDLLNGGSIQKGLYQLFPQMRKKEFKTISRCRDCEIAQFCMSCPGRAYLETGNLEAPVEWFCELAHLVAGK